MKKSILEKYLFWRNIDFGFLINLFLSKDIFSYSIVRLERIRENECFNLVS